MNVRQLMTPGFLGAGLLLLSACATPPRIHKMYSGDPLPVSQISRVHVPYTLNIRSVNGEKFKPDAAFKVYRGNDLVFQPGAHTLDVRYQEMFDMASDDPKAVSAGPFTLELELRAGTAYRLEHDAFDDADDASDGARKLHIRLVKTGPLKKAPTFEADAQPPVNKPSEPSTPRRLKAPGDQPASPDKPEPIAAETSTSADISALDMLIYWWDKATPAEKTTFRRHIH